MIAHNPLHGSGRAAFPHPALALGDDAHAPQGIGMTDGRQRQPASDRGAACGPKGRDRSDCAATSARCQSRPTWNRKSPQRVLVHGHPVVPDVSTHHRLQPFAHFRDGFVHPSLKFGFHLIQLRLQPFADRLPQHRIQSIASLLHADMRKAEEVERLRFPFSTPLPVGRSRYGPNSSSRVFSGCSSRLNFSHSFRKFRPKLIGIRFAVKSNHDVVGEAHDDDISVCPLPTPCLDPQVEYVMKIDVRQKRREHFRPEASLLPSVFVSHPPARRHSAISG